MLADQSHQCHQPDLRVNIQGRQTQIDENQCAEQRHRHGHQNDDGIAETLEQCRQRQKDDDQRKHQGHQKATRLLDELPRLARVVDRIAARRHLPQRVTQILQHLALGDRRCIDAGDGG